MEKKWLVRIFVPSPDGAGDEGAIGTGYPVTNNRILTARHILYPRTADAKIEVRWHYLSGADRDWRPAKIAWEDEECDVALLEVPFPEHLQGLWALSSRHPDETMHWVSAGFARAGKKGDQRQAVGLGGRVYPRAPRERLELGVDDTTDLYEGWKGASGCPVFVCGQIIGVVLEVPANFGQRRLEAAAVYDLLEDAGFRKAIGFDNRLARVTPIKREIIKALSGSHEAIAFLKDLDENPHKDGKVRAEGLAGKLLKLPLHELLETLRTSYRSLLSEDCQPGAAAIRTVAHWIIPAVFDPGLTDAVRAHRGDTAAAMINLTAATRTVAEIIMAGADGRRMRCHTPSQDEHWPEGMFVLPLPPEGGFEEGGQAFQEAFHTHLIQKFTDAEMRSTRDRKTLIGYVSDDLLFKAEEEAETWYFIFSPPVDPELRMEIDAAVRVLKQDYPAIVFINLSEDADLFRHETRLFRPVREMLSEAGVASQ